MFGNPLMLNVFENNCRLMIKPAISVSSYVLFTNIVCLKCPYQMLAINCFDDDVHWIANQVMADIIAVLVSGRVRLVDLEGRVMVIVRFVVDPLFVMSDDHLHVRTSPANVFNQHVAERLAGEYVDGEIDCRIEYHEHASYFPHKKEYLEHEQRLVVAPCRQVPQ